MMIHLLAIAVKTSFRVLLVMIFLFHQTAKMCLTAAPDLTPLISRTVLFLLLLILTKMETGLPRVKLV